MKKYLSLGLVVLLSLTTYGQTRSKRLYVSFQTIPTTGSDALTFYRNLSPEFTSIWQAHSFDLHSPFEGKSDVLDKMALNARKNSGSDASVQKLKGLYLVQITGTEVEQQDLANALRKLPFVNYCSFMDAEPIPVPFDIPPTTNDFQPLQGYIGSDPGVNMQYVWDQGITGQGINVRDVEYGINVNHEELNEQNTFIAPGMTVNPGATEAYTEHGTAAIGVLYASNGDYGSTGLIHGAEEVILFSEYTVEHGYDRVNAVFEAIGSSDPGDVIMYEMQSYGAVGSGSDYVPAEYDEPVWDLTKAATDGGVVIVAAAGNGNQNLDAALYSDYMARGHSGAIIVGAGSPNTSHNRLSFSTYGSRVDLQGWGSNVFSPGYGDAFTIDGDFNQQYTYFSGTSSATPMVTSCVVALQSLYFNEKGLYLSGSDIRDILLNTGIPQGSGTSGPIGPLPNMQAAYDYLASSLGVNQLASGESVQIYPNPANHELTILFSGDNAQLVFYDATGRKVTDVTMHGGTSVVDVSNFERGMYLVELQTANGALTNRVVLR